MSTTTCNPDGSLSMTGNDKPKPLDELYIVRVSNGWMLFNGTFSENMPDCVRHPNFVFNDHHELVEKISELLGTDVTITKLGTIRVDSPS